MVEPPMPLDGFPLFLAVVGGHLGIVQLFSHVGGAHDDIEETGRLSPSMIPGGMMDTSRRRKDQRHEEDND